MKKILIFFVVITLYISSLFSLFGQGIPTPCFKVSSIKGCVPFTVTVKNCSHGPNEFYNFDYRNNPTNFTQDSVYTYTKPGTYTIRQFVQLTTNYKDTIIQVTSSPNPVFTVQSCQGLSVSVNITDLVYDKFAIDFGDGSAIDTVLTGTSTNHIYSVTKYFAIKVTGVFNPSEACGSKTDSIFAINTLIKPDLVDLHVLKQQITGGSTQLRFNSITGYRYAISRNINGGAYTPIDTIIGNGTLISFTDINLNTQANVYGYIITNFDDCGNSIASNNIYSITIQATPTNMLNTINWLTNPSTVNFYTLNKNAVTLSGNAASPYLDNAIVCGSTYCYQTIETLNTLTASGAPQLSYSIDSCIKGISTSIPPTIQNVNSTMNGNTATISWTAPASLSKYNLLRSVNGGAYTKIDTLSTNSYQQSLDLSNNYCYQLNYIDLCGNASLNSLSTCPVILTGTQPANTIILNWSPYTGYDNSGVSSYVVEKLNESGTIISQTNVGTSTTFSDPVNYTDLYVQYIIKVIPVNATLPNVFSNNVAFQFEAKLYAPDIFTPNGDNSNDIFLLKGKYINTFNLTVFNRWGEIVFNSSAITDGWDGNFKGIYAPEGAYTYKVIATDINNKELIKTGTVTLAR